MKALSSILTKREMDYARMVTECLSNVEIGKALGVSRATVRLKLHIIYEKIGWAGEGHLKPRIMLALWYDRENRLSTTTV